jgi:hypothetical protein
MAVASAWDTQVYRPSVAVTALALSAKQRGRQPPRDLQPSFRSKRSLRHTYHGREVVTLMFLRWGLRCGPDGSDKAAMFWRSINVRMQLTPICGAPDHTKSLARVK